MGNDGDGTKLLLDPLQCLMCCHAYDFILSLKQTFYDFTDKETEAQKQLKELVQKSHRWNKEASNFCNTN